MVKIQWWQVVLLPMRLMVMLWWGICCTFGWHAWYQKERPAWREGVPVPTGWNCWDECAHCGRRQPGSYHREPWRNGQTPTEYARKQATLNELARLNQQ